MREFVALLAWVRRMAPKVRFTGDPRADRRDRQWSQERWAQAMDLADRDAATAGLQEAAAVRDAHLARSRQLDPGGRTERLHVLCAGLHRVRGAALR